MGKRKQLCPPQPLSPLNSSIFQHLVKRSGAISANDEQIISPFHDHGCFPAAWRVAVCAVGSLSVLSCFKCIASFSLRADSLFLFGCFWHSFDKVLQVARPCSGWPPTVPHSRASEAPHDKLLGWSWWEWMECSLGCLTLTWDVPTFYWPTEGVGNDVFLQKGGTTCA